MKWLESKQIDAIINKWKDYRAKNPSSIEWNRTLLTDSLFYQWTSYAIYQSRSYEWWEERIFTKHTLFTTTTPWQMLDKILIPANMTEPDRPEGLHWILIIILPRKRKIMIADSLTNQYSKKHLEMIQPLMKIMDMYSKFAKCPQMSFYENDLRKLVPEQHHEEPLLTQWRLDMVQFQPLQQNSDSCGYYMILVMLLSCFIESESCIRAVRVLSIKEIYRMVKILAPQEIYSSGISTEMMLAEYGAEFDLPFTPDCLKHLLKYCQYAKQSIYHEPYNCAIVDDQQNNKRK